MPPFLLQLWRQITGIWGGLQGGQRLTTVLVLAGFAFGLGGVLWFAGRPDFVTLGSGYEADELQAISGALSDAGVQFKVQGNTIQVDNKDMTAARNAMARAGLPGQESDLRALESAGNLALSKPLMNFKMQILQARMVEGQIRQMDGVREVKVKPNIPEARVFIGEADAVKPSAVVTVKLRTGRALAELGSAIVTVVSHGLGIPRENVGVVDQNGQQFREGDAGGTGGGPMDREAMALERQVSEQKTAFAQAALERIYPGQTLVRVDVTLDQVKEVTQESILPAEKIVLQETKKERSTIGKTGGSDAPAAAPVGSTPAAPASPPTTKDTESSKTYQGPTGTRRKTDIAPKIKRMTVSLALDKKNKELEGKLREVESLVKNTVGLDSSRKDEITTILTEFPAEEVLPPPGLSAWLPQLKEYLPPVAQVASVLIALLFLRGLLRRSARPARAEASLALAPGKAGVQQPPTEDDPVVMRAEIERMVSADPSVVSRMLESWLSGKG